MSPFVLISRTYRHAEEAGLCIDVCVHGHALLGVLGVEGGNRRVVRHLANKTLNERRLPIILPRQGLRLTSSIGLLLVPDSQLYH